MNANHATPRDETSDWVFIQLWVAARAERYRPFGDIPALKRRHCGASRCVSNFGLKFASRLNSL
jgi:hypothetical protein